ncbi:hypothetical protein Hypma_004943 [Hypsizygus marmoreus]|uniref:Uncharacterized protein n=1 Tax=Hypsizygus marmoreus TaxID=39966 RepID=A0A369K5G0_HYPMA|nr:hypothetical protein Hypma_004943 [Hypsizygus marmoreus]
MRLRFAGCRGSLYVRTYEIAVCGTCGIGADSTALGKVWLAFGVRMTTFGSTHTVKNALFVVSGGGRVLGRRGDEKKRKGKEERKREGEGEDIETKMMHRYLFNTRSSTPRLGPNPPSQYRVDAAHPILLRHRTEYRIPNTRTEGTFCVQGRRARA